MPPTRIADNKGVSDLHSRSSQTRHPVIISRMMMPRLHKSTAPVYSRPMLTSGARYGHVTTPGVTPAPPDIVASISAFVSMRAKPKSATHTRNSLAVDKHKMLGGFRSRCQRLRLCMCCSPAAICIITWTVSPRANTPHTFDHLRGIVDCVKTSD